MKTILISGGTGLVGTRLSEMLLTKGYRVSHLSRSPQPTALLKSYYWNIETQELDKEAIETADVIIHLAGEGIVDKKWTTKRKQAIVDSRVKTAQLLHTAVLASEHKPEALISASAIGYYGFSSSAKTFSERDSPGNDFTSKTCIAWENAVLPFDKMMRTVRIRIGIVLAKNGGALPKLALPIRLYVGSALGSGEQYVAWIHLDDLCSIFIKAIEDQNMNGVYNAVAPHPISQKELTQELASVLHRPLLLPPVPEFALKLLLGDRADLVLKGNRVSCEKLQHTGFQFAYSDLKKALFQIYNDVN